MEIEQNTIIGQVASITQIPYSDRKTGEEGFFHFKTPQKKGQLKVNCPDKKS